MINRKWIAVFIDCANYSSYFILIFYAQQNWWLLLKWVVKVNFPTAIRSYANPFILPKKYHDVFWIFWCLLQSLFWLMTRFGFEDGIGNKWIMEFT